jgi:hyperosmotically inducible periplasmic protein
MRKAAIVVLSWVVLFAAGGARAKEQHATNAQITAEIQDKLYHAQVFKHGDVKVSFEDGVATLTGSVDSLGVKNDATRALRKVDDVVEVRNELEIKAEDVSDQQIVEQARKDIVTYPFYTIFDNIVLKCQDHLLEVDGQVTEPVKKADIGNFLERVKGVREVRDNLEVLPVSNFDDQLRLAIARAIYNDANFVHYANQALPPIHIIVKNGNVTLEGVVLNQIDRVKAENDARFAGTFFSLTNNLRVERG